MKYYAIIVAGGKGNRMNLEVAKQFLELDGKPILMHTLEAFHKCVLNPELILVLNIHQHLFWEKLCTTHDFKIPHQVVKGGQERFDSVRNGLKAIKGKAIVAIHDAVRPLVSAELISQSYLMAEEKGNAITAIQPVDSVRIKREGQNSEALNRNELFMIQTPQTFQIEQLRKAYLQPYRNEFTDDASVVERAGFNINLLTGERNNIKITYPQDLELASFLLQKKGS
ncbi:2-C-methyl-D-erythritol 4-phosphate cytidylyltransferase [Pedobacter cryoconitis]|uniref:2-C-methyl-D-erythritol 4-phosphate cytidylyltransferase n=1 Tax=Pedobacter cryoconitis TaxID=188932 RepID=A0A7X0J6P3_9SPHI|nr:2-C-methyl-D-erythritol 4-phosphate cytidylyltransferase [Pedobacter cryoconitis]MBB6502108.1 2-C-methyl-D-erythritol 4-phosphate cytidylyltransferase [Pedobacter cryoconitis]